MENYDDFVNLLHKREKKGRPRLPFTVQTGPGKSVTLTSETDLDYGLDRIWVKASQFGRHKLLHEHSWQVIFTRAALAVRDRKLVLEKMQRAREMKKRDAASPFHAERVARKAADKRAEIGAQLDTLIKLAKRVKLQNARSKLQIGTATAFSKLAKSAGSRVLYSLTGSQNA